MTPEEKKAYMKAYRAKNADRIKEQRREYDKRYYEVNKERLKFNSRENYHLKLETDPEAVRAKRKAQYWSDPEKHRAQTRAWAEANPEKKKSSRKLDYAKNPQYYKDKARDWQKENPGKKVLYKDYVRQRTPAWADLEAIHDFYVGCPEGYVVDHIIPLRGRNVSGLHVLENLQYLTYDENRKKNAKFEGE